MVGILENVSDDAYSRWKLMNNIKVGNSLTNDRRNRDVRGRFARNFAEGIRNLDCGDYREAVRHFECALKHDAVHQETLKYLVDALKGVISTMTEEIRDLKSQLNQKEKLEITMKGQGAQLKPQKVLEPVKYQISPGELIDINGLKKHLEYR